MHTAMKVIDSDMWNNPEASYRHISWPAKTAFPVGFFGPSDPWSISLNPLEYDSSKTKDISVELTRLNDKKEWKFSKQGVTSDGFFTINTGDYGYTPFTIIFQPKQNFAYNSKDRYSVEVNGLYSKNGKKTKLKYETVFFELKD